MTVVAMSLGKHFINGVNDPIQRALRAALYADPSLRLIPEEKVLYRQESCNSDKVLLMAGGGSGHEPAYAGYVGEGMLDISVAGHIFASPSASQVVAGLRAVKSSKGTLIIVKNYTGDKLNFGLAAEKAKASGELVNVVFVADDVSVDGNTLVGQRGLAGVTLVIKIAGALAAKGASLEDVTSIANKVSGSMATAAASLDRCSVPNRGVQQSLPYGDLEYGMGIHNEPGVKRASFVSLEESVQRVINMVLAPQANRWTPQLDQEVALMVNNLGGLSVLELNIIADEVIQQLRARGIRLSRLLVGTFLTSLDGPGFSITLLGLDHEIRKLLDSATTAPAWPRKVSALGENVLFEQVIKHDSIQNGHKGPLSNGNNSEGLDTTLVGKLISSISETTLQDEPDITKFDTIAGDGDCGETLLSGVKALNDGFNKSRDCHVMLPSTVFRLAADAAERGMGGTSGAIYAIFLNAVSNALVNATAFGKQSPDAIRSALKSGLEELYKYTLARKGHRTLMDALIPFVESIQNQDLREAYLGAKKGADATVNMSAAMGRASYVGKEILDEEGGVPDPGALGVVSVIRGICLAMDIEI